jgi:hypothetical protein
MSLPPEMVQETRFPPTEGGFLPLWLAYDDSLPCRNRKFRKSLVSANSVDRDCVGLCNAQLELDAIDRPRWG